MTMVRLTAGLIIFSALALSGCSDVRRALGYDKSPPDEFAVVARAPLSQPPDFTLRPPMPGAPRPQEGTVRDQAKSVLVAGNAGMSLGGSLGQTAPVSQGEQLLLSKAGADKADPDIRRKVDQETTGLIQADESFTDKILFWQDKPNPNDTALDPAKEAQRLQAKTAGAPQITRHGQGFLGLGSSQSSQSAPTTAPATPTTQGGQNAQAAPPVLQGSQSYQGAQPAQGSQSGQSSQGGLESIGQGIQRVEDTLKGWFGDIF